MNRVSFDGFSFAEGGVTAAKGFLASGIHCGICGGEKKDLGLLTAEHSCAAAAVFSRNRLKGAPLLVSKAHLESGTAQAVIINAGVSNLCTEDGLEKAEGMCLIASAALDIPASEVLTASVGVLGKPLALAPVQKGIASLKAGLSAENHALFAEAGTDSGSFWKEIAVTFSIGGKKCRIGGCSTASGRDGAGTPLLTILTTDAAIDSQLLQTALKQAVDDTLHMVCSGSGEPMNQMTVLLASGEAGNCLLQQQGNDFENFCNALYVVLMNLSREAAGEGARLLECVVEGAASRGQAQSAAKAVAGSPAVRAALSRALDCREEVLCALGCAEMEANELLGIDLSFASRSGAVQVCADGIGVDFSEEDAGKILDCDEVKILISLNHGEFSAAAWGRSLDDDCGSVKEEL